MRIDPNDLIADRPAILVRRLLRRATGRHWRSDLVEQVLGVRHEEAERVVHALAELGYIQRTEWATDSWSNTTRGNALANATAARPIRRATAAAALEALLKRVEDVNRDPHYLYRVRSVIVFGSYLSDRHVLNDVDVAVAIEPKETDAKVRMRLEERRVSEAMRAGRRFSSITEQLAWPQTEVWLHLKARSRTLSLHDFAYEEDLVRQGPCQVLFTSQ